MYKACACNSTPRLELSLAYAIDHYKGVFAQYKIVCKILLKDFNDIRYFYRAK